MKRILMLVLIVLSVSLMLVGFTACSNDKEAAEPTIIGKWVYESSDDMYYTFNEDGTGSYFFIGGELKFTYEDSGEAVTIHYETATEPSVFKYTIEGDTLKIEDSFGDMVTYIKK